MCASASLPVKTVSNFEPRLELAPGNGQHEGYGLAGAAGLLRMEAMTKHRSHYASVRGAVFTHSVQLEHGIDRIVCWRGYAKQAPNSTTFPASQSSSSRLAFEIVQHGSLEGGRRGLGELHSVLGEILRYRNAPGAADPHHLAHQAVKKRPGVGVLKDRAEWPASRGGCAG